RRALPRRGGRDRLARGQAARRDRRALGRPSRARLRHGQPGSRVLERGTPGGAAMGVAAMSEITKTKLKQLAVELQEVVEQIDRVANDVDGVTPQLVGVAEIAEMTGITPRYVTQLAHRRRLPQPVAELECGRIWLRADIEQWHEGRAE